MIQRKQTLYLLATLGLLILLFFIPYAELITAEGTKLWLTLKNHSVPNDSGTAFLFLRFSQATAIITGLSLFISIFLYKKRPLQMKVCSLNMVLVVIQTLILFSEILYITSTLKHTVAYKISIIFPLIGLIMIYLAYWGIKKDDELVRSLDRIR